MKCRLCHSNDLKLYYTQGFDNQFKFYKCRNCGLVNQDIIQDLDQAKYTEIYIDPFDEKHAHNRSNTESYAFLKRMLPQKGDYLDIGCGNGRLLHLAKQDGWQVRGLELSQFYADEIKKTLDIDVEVGNFLEYEVSEKQYDLVSLRHVLEHLPDSILAMQKISLLLKTNGHALLEFPNIDGFQKRRKRFFEKLGIHKKKYAKSYVPGHCNEFNRKAFTFLTEKTGFEIVKWETYSSKPILNAIYKITNGGSKVRVLVRKK